MSTYIQTQTTQAIQTQKSVTQVMRQLYFLQFISVAVGGMVGPFFNIYLVDAGLSATLIGTLLSAGALIELILTPVLNNFADRHHVHRRLFVIYMVIFGLAQFIYAGSTHVILLALATVMVQVSLRPGSTIEMQLTMTRLEQIGSQAIGRIRSFAALGYSVASLAAAPLFALGGYPLIFGAGGLLSAWTVQISGVLPAHAVTHKVESKPAPRRRGFYLLALSQFFIMMGVRAAYAFWLVHFHQSLGVPTGNIGLIMAFIAGVEVPFFILLDPIMKRLNPRKMFIIGSAGMGVFFLLLGFADSIIWLVPLIIVRGLIWPMYHLATFIVTSKISHPNNVATNQALINVTIPSLAVLLTGSAAGWLFDSYDPWIFFGICAFVAFIGMAIAFFGYHTMAPITDAAIAAPIEVERELEQLA